MRLSLDGGTDGGPWRVDWNGYYGTRLYDYIGNRRHARGLSEVATGRRYAAKEIPPMIFNRVGPFAGLSLGRRPS